MMTTTPISSNESAAGSTAGVISGTAAGNVGAVCRHTLRWDQRDANGKQISSYHIVRRANGLGVVCRNCGKFYGYLRPPKGTA
jgi:hypothetical protein